MSNYLIRNVSQVQPQSTTTPATILGAPVWPPRGPVLFIGLDVHTDSIAVSLAASGGAEVRR